MRPEVGLHRERPVRPRQPLTCVEDVLDVSEVSNGAVTTIGRCHQKAVPREIRVGATTDDLAFRRSRIDLELDRSQSVADGATSHNGASVSRHEGHQFDVVDDAGPTTPDTSLRCHQPRGISQFRAQQRLSPDSLERRMTTRHVAAECSQRVRIRVGRVKGPSTLREYRSQQMLFAVFGDEECSLMHQRPRQSRRVGFCVSGA